MIIPWFLFLSFIGGTRRVHSLTRRVGSGFRARVSWRLGESVRLGETLNPRVTHYLSHLMASILASFTLKAVRKP